MKIFLNDIICTLQKTEEESPKPKEVKNQLRPEDQQFLQQILRSRGGSGSFSQPSAAAILRAECTLTGPAPTQQWPVNQSIMTTNQLSLPYRELTSGEDVTGMYMCFLFRIF